MYIHGKMTPVETIPGTGGEEGKENDGGVSSTMIYLIYSKNFCKYHNVPPSSTAIKIKNNEYVENLKINWSYRYYPFCYGEGI
jgi:hypothetical protein